MNTKTRSIGRGTPRQERLVKAMRRLRALRISGYLSWPPAGVGHRIASQYSVLITRGRMPQPHTLVKISCSYRGYATLKFIGYLGLFKGAYRLCKFLKIKRKINANFRFSVSSIESIELARNLNFELLSIKFSSIKNAFKVTS